MCTRTNVPDDGCAGLLWLRVDLQATVGGDEGGPSTVPAQSTEQAVTCSPSEHQAPGTPHPPFSYLKLQGKKGLATRFCIVAC